MSSEVEALLGACPMPKLDHDEVLLGHGSGGTLTAELVERVFVPAFRNPTLERLDDAAVVELGGARLAFTTDAFVVSPPFFPGGDIGCLAVHGTVNDLAMSGATPRHLAVSMILEEGLLLEDLRRIASSMAAAAADAGVTIVTGDTKVVGRGHGDRIFITTTGIGVVPAELELGRDPVGPGDALIVSGTLGDHGAAILTLREGLGLEGNIESDTAALHGLVAAMLAAAPRVRVLRDPTRGGLATVLHEIASRHEVGVDLDERRLPVREDVRGACELLGVDPLYVANEGKLMAVVADADADAVLSAMRAHPLGRDAARVGTITAEHPRSVVLRTGIGGSRVLERPHGELLPRIC